MPELGHAVDENPGRAYYVDQLLYPTCGRIAFHLRGCEHIVGAHLCEELGGGTQVQKLHSGEVEPEYCCVLPDLALRLT